MPTRTPAKIKREIKREIREAYKAGRTVPYDLRTLIESGASLKVIRAVRRDRSDK
jgi:hypothetical protein